MSFPIPEQAKNFLADIDHRTSGNTVLHQFEAQTGLPRSYAVLGFVAVYFVLIFLNVGGVGQLLSNIAGFVVPGYYSLLALSTVSKNDDTQLLTYWVVFAFLNVIEFWSKAILYWIPFYFLFKTIFLLYIGIPAFGGATTVYLNIIKPFAEQYILAEGAGIAKKLDEAAEGISSGVEL
ncbi:TB2/DP1, HVA22 family-domain-containing protein [Scheffersomyces coipomensis]|uniref:TB2/DP1, HVA22 family-domain-containing protein n=1 Tax=Scheffersomyces coipomensis TaxID=1788519 RepID=UPI00315CCD67